MDGDGLARIMPLHSSDIFRKSHQSNRLNPVPFGNDSEKICLGGGFLPPYLQYEGLRYAQYTNTHKTYKIRKVVFVMHLAWPQHCAFYCFYIPTKVPIKCSTLPSWSRLWKSPIYVTVRVRNRHLVTTWNTNLIRKMGLGTRRLRIQWHLTLVDL